MLTAAFLVLSLLGTLSAHYPDDELKTNFELLSERDNNLGDPNYRLLTHVQPRHVYVHINTIFEESSFNGLMEMIVETDRPLTQIVFHQKVVRVLTVTVSNEEGSPIALTNYETDDYFELMKLNFVNELPAGTYTITISYLGQINDNPYDRGFYKGYYFVGNEKRFYATTQFQAYHARKAFPCFDEPQFKAHYTIAITRPITFSESFSNMAINTTEVFESEGRVRETFDRTPRVSAYLVAFHVSDFDQTANTGTDDKPFRIISRPNVQSQHAFAASVGVDITEELSNYLDYDYYTMGEGVSMKNDHIALPDFPSGAMENWGMVNYREANLLNDDTNTNLVNRISIATIIAHEMAHKWFGNLVTCFWWSNLWLNESFASFFEYFAAHAARSELELDSQFIIDYVHSALLYDAGAGATAMNLPVQDGPSIWAHFSTASYAKGASVLRMLQHFVGPDTFQKALRQYLKNNAYDVGTPELLYNEFSTAVVEDDSLADFPNVNIATLIDNWVQNAGAPVVEVTVDNENGRIALAQRRYALTPVTGTTTWQIPLTWTRGGSPDFSSTKPTHVMTTLTDTITKPEEQEWVIFNNQQSGYYRVKYDEQNYELIAAALLEESKPIHRFNRAQIVNDALVFFRGNDLTPEIAFNIIAFLRGETDYYVWAAALGQLEWIRRRMDHIPQLQEEFEKYLLIQLETVIEELGYTEREGDTTAIILNRMQIMNLACNIGHEGCVENSLQLWNAYKADRTAVIPANLRRYVYCVGLRNGDRTDYDILYNLYLASENTADMVTILRALGCTNDTGALNHYLTQSIENDHIRYHDRTNAFLYALQGNPENIKIVLPFVQENYERIRENYGGLDRFGVSISNLAGFLTDFDDVVEFQAWLYSHQRELDGVFNNGVGTIRTSVSNMQWANGIAVDTYNYLIAYNGVENIIASSFLIFVVVIFNLLR